jgi:hypothetical protein
MRMKLGRKPALIPASLRDLAYYAAGPLPTPPAAVPVPAIADWQVLGNDTVGNCGTAGLEHGMMAAAAADKENEGFPTASEAVSYYLDYTGGQDNGVVLSQYLAYVKQQKFYGHAVAAYAPVSVSDIATLQFAVDAYDFAYAGITVYDAMMQATQNGQPWTMATAAGSIAGGHCVPIVGYDDQYLYVVTWGAVQAIAYPAWHRIAEEAWAVLTGEITAAGTDGHGINLGALQADLNRLTT